ncbi:MAG TPA: adenylate/guanylate cyclase domain-containing protein [Gaiellaceae bacterium]|nr:adenylate/guanylate cyclase domain-containing protein [Gaiellaceae bacterium]
MGAPTTTTTRVGFGPYVPQIAAEWDLEAPGATVRELEASLLGLDISGFTALSERLAERGKLGAEELITLISRCYSGLIDTAARYGGDVLKFRGDALLLLYHGERHEERAALSALAMQAHIAGAGRSESSVGPVELAMSSGLVSGACHLFLLGTHQRELVVCGPAASLTLELEDAAEAGEVLVSARTAEALEGLVAGERNGAYLLRAGAAPAELPSAPAERDEPAHLAEHVPPALRAPIAGDAVEAEHRHATAAFVKFSGTDALVEDLDAAAASLAALAEVVSEETFARSLTWLESDIDRDGGKLYLVAGAPATGEDDEERMLRAARAIVDAHAGPPIAIGINRGRVLAGPIGAPSRRTYAVMGDTVNLAARLTARAAKGQILTTAEVLQRSRTQFETSAQQFLMKGKAKPVTGHTVGPIAAEGVEETRPLLPLIGRDAELATLHEALDAARSRQCRAVELVGDAGAGKSRLLEELSGSALGFQVLRTRCEPYSASTPFAPLRALLRPLVGILPDDPPETAGAKLSAFAQAAMPDLAGWLPLLALPFDADVPSTAEVDEIDPAFRRDRLHDALDQFLTRMLLMPTAILVEDTHLLDDASQLVLAKLAQPGPKPWLVVTTRRPSGPPLAGATAIELQPLSADDARALALAAAGDELTLSDAELTALTERAAGNPLFIRELALSPTVGDALPETVESLLTTRIDTLSPADRLLLRHASVIGPSFGLGLLEEILPDDVGDPERWSRLADFVEWDGPDHLRFRHALVHDAAYGGLSYAKRGEIHALVGEAIERGSFDSDLDAGVLSLHFVAAGEWAKAWRYAVLSGDAARAKYANVDAATFYERALAAAGGVELPEGELARVCEALGDVRELAARYEEAGAAYERAIATGGVRARLLRKRGIAAERLGSYEDALALYDAAAEEADPAESVAVELARAVISYRQGRIDECARRAEAAAEAARAIGDRAALADAFRISAAAEGDRGGPAWDFLNLALPIYQELGLVHRQANLLNNMGVRAYYEGRWDESVDYYLRAEDAMRASGDVLAGGATANNRAEILLDQGRLDEASELFETALRVYRSAKFPAGEGLVAINLGRIAAEQGRFTDAHAHFDEAVALLHELGSESFLIETDARRAQAYVLEGRHEDAAALASTALERMAATGEVGVRTALLERLLAIAAVQGRRPADAPAHFDRSLAVARELAADYELARTLQARVLTGLAADGDAAEAKAILERLGAVALPNVPLP